MSKEIKEAIKKRRSLVELEGLNFHQVEAQLNILLGKILTIIDSSISEERKNKATKDLVRSMFYEQIKWINGLCSNTTEDSSILD